MSVQFSFTCIAMIIEPTAIGIFFSTDISHNKLKTQNNQFVVNTTSLLFDL